MRTHTGPAALIVNPARVDLFRMTLAAQYETLFRERTARQPARNRAMALASKMTAGLIDGSANHDGEGIKRTCQALGVKHTRTAIRQYLSTHTAG